MFRATITAITFSIIMLTGSILIIPATSGVHGDIALSQLSFSTPTGTRDIPRQADFTVYVPSNPYDIAVADNALNQIGISPHKFGLLWTFSVPAPLAQTVNNTLHSLTYNSGITFFYNENQTIVSPSLTYSYVGQNLNIPFAFTPNILARAYNFTWPIAHGINGSGITIGIVDAYGNPNINYDLRAFDSVNGLPPVNLSIQYPNGVPATYNATWAMETSTDVEWAHALAPAARIVLLVATSPYTNELQAVVSYAVSNHLANILSLSWGSPETALSASSELTYSKVYSQAASQGITVLAASGDNGAYTGSKLSVDFPASDPNVTGVGGTSLYAVADKFQQSGWGGVVNGQSYGSGGGYSTVFNTPYWQSAKGYNNTRRGVPDVAMDANKYTGVYVISSGGQYIVGGTSVATPIWADVVALIEQKAGVHLPSINPLLYQISRTPLYDSAFTQIVSGTNGYYLNSPYWNPVTGLGTPKVSALINASREIIDGYGGIALFNGTRSYNATGISADFNLTPNQERLANNGTTFYYAGFYSGPLNYVRFGVTLNSSGESLKLVLAQSGVQYIRSYAMPPVPSEKLILFNVGISIGQYDVTITTSDGFTRSIPAFLNFSGTMVPMLGTSQFGSQTNLTLISPGTFSSIALSNGSTPFSPEYAYFQHYDHIGLGSYSTIDASYAGGQLQFYSSVKAGNSFLGSAGSAVPEITYRQSYGYPSQVAFSLSGVSGTVNWTFDNVSHNSNIFYVRSGGFFTVNATYTSSGVLKTVSRNITLPSLHLANVSVNYSINGTNFPGTEITALYFYSYAYSEPGMQIPALNLSTPVSASATGFYGGTSTISGSQNVSLKLVPMNVSLSIFVFNANATVTFDNLTVPQAGGYHVRSVSPGMPVNINISATGYSNQSEKVLLQPGENLSVQANLMPVLGSFNVLSGTVTDSIYAFPVEGALVRLNSTDGSYTNSTGYYFVYPATGKYNVSASADMYDNFSTPLNITSSTVLDIRMNPSKITATPGESVSITHYFPLLFYFGYVSWTPYKGQNFSIYQVYVSNNQNFLSPEITTVTSQNTSYAFLKGLSPGSPYYISVVIRLSNSQVYQSQVVKITYANPVYLGVNLVLLGAIGFYIYVGYRVFMKKKSKIGFQ